MSDVFNPIDKRLDLALAELKQRQARDEVVGRAERRLLTPQVVRRRPIWLVPAFGAVAAAAASVFFLTSSKTASAEEVLALVGDAESVFSHCRIYRIDPDGKASLDIESYTSGKDSLTIFPNGNQELWSKGRCHTWYPDNSVVVRDMPVNVQRGRSASDLLKINDKARITVSDGILWNGVQARQYDGQESFLDGRNQWLHIKWKLLADPDKNLPIHMEAGGPGYPAFSEDWDYPAFDAAKMRLPIDDRTRVYDFDSEMKLVLHSLATPGRAARVGMGAFELRLVVVDEDGLVSVTGKADYDYPLTGPGSVPLLINGVAWRSYYGAVRLSGDGRTAVVDRELSVPVQSFGARLPKSATIPTVLNLDVPVWHNGQFQGYAHFANVRVIQTKSCPWLLTPMNVPVWDKDGQRRKSVTP